MANNIQRINYHTGLFLEEMEFKLEQSYHLLMRRRLNYAMFTPGVLFGLTIDYDGTVLKVKPGMAVDEFSISDGDEFVNFANGEVIGREIVLPAEISSIDQNSKIDLSSFKSGETVYITIQYGFIKEYPKAPTDQPSRTTENSQIVTSKNNPGPGKEKILLGSIVIGTPSSTTVAEQKATLRLGSGMIPSTKPIITSFSPLSGKIGTSVQITGSHFNNPSTTVSFGKEPAIEFSIVSDIQITAKVPAGAVTGKIRVTNPVGFGESDTDFQILASITSFIPDKGPVGTPVVIYGAGFTGVTNITFGGVGGLFNATGKDFKGEATSDNSKPPKNMITSADQEKYYKVISATQIEATVPTGAVTGTIEVVTTAGSSGPSASNFTVGPNPPSPTVNLLQPSTDRTRPIGGELPIPGTNFVERIFVTFNFDNFGNPLAGGTVEVEGTVDNPSLAKVIVPNGAITGGYIKVKTQGGEVLSNRPIMISK